MKSKEIERFIQFELKDRWPDWEPTAAQVRDLNSWLEPVSYEQATNAASQHKAENGYKIPDIGKISKLCKTMSDTHRSVTSVHCYAVFHNERQLRSVVIQIPGLVEINDENYFRVKSRAEIYFNQMAGYYGYGDYTPYIGEENFKNAKTHQMGLVGAK